MFRKPHGPFCRCEMCRLKRKTNPLYTWILFAIGIIVLYQAILLLFFTSTVYIFLLLIELILLFLGIFLILL